MTVLFDFFIVDLSFGFCLSTRANITQYRLCSTQVMTLLTLNRLNLMYPRRIIRLPLRMLET
jgi:hypothetical protein